MSHHKYISNLSLAISKHSHDLTTMEKDMIHDIMKQHASFTYKSFTILKIAEKLNVSSTSIHRLSKKLGYESFTLFKEDYFNRYLTSHIEDKKQDDYLAILTGSYHFVEEQLHTDLIQRMYDAKKITIYGMGMHSYLAKMFQIKLQLMGFSVQCYDDSRYMRLSIQHLHKASDIVLILSSSGQTPELVETINAIHLRSIPSILITETRDTPLDSMADFVIYTESSQDNDTDINTRIGTHIALDRMMQALQERKEVMK